MFAVPAYPLEEVIDPTGAGDTFAGGFMGYLARHGRVNEAILRTAVVYGSVLASFVVERFSLERLTTLTWEEVDRRYRAFIELTDCAAPPMDLSVVIPLSTSGTTSAAARGAGARAGRARPLLRNAVRGRRQSPTAATRCCAKSRPATPTCAYSGWRAIGPDRGAGLRTATAPAATMVVAIDGDGENDPADIPRLLPKLDEGYDLVSGWRTERWASAR